MCIVLCCSIALRSPALAQPRESTFDVGNSYYNTFATRRGQGLVRSGCSQSIGLRKPCRSRRGQVAGTMLHHEWAAVPQSPLPLLVQYSDEEKWTCGFCCPVPCVRSRGWVAGVPVSRFHYYDVLFPAMLDAYVLWRRPPRPAPPRETRRARQDMAGLPQLRRRRTISACLSTHVPRTSCPI